MASFFCVFVVPGVCLPSLGRMAFQGVDRGRSCCPGHVPFEVEIPGRRGVPALSPHVVFRTIAMVGGVHGRLPRSIAG